MRNLVPLFILENLKNNITCSQLEAIAMFVDITGFTSITEKMMNEGNEGTEMLSMILNDVFKTCVSYVYNSGGFITNFAGDSFTAIFPFEKNKLKNENAKRVINCSSNILNYFIKRGNFKTKFGTYIFKAKIGIAAGNISWKIAGEPFLYYYFKGKALINAIMCEKHSAGNEIIIHRSVLKLTGSSLKEIQQIKPDLYRYFSNFFSLIISGQLQQSSLSGITKEIFTKKFVPARLLILNDAGEFRNVVSIFISFNESLTSGRIDNFIKNVIEAVNKYSAYMKDIDFSDKGGVIACFMGAPLTFDDNISRAADFIQYLFSKIKINKDIKAKAGITYGRVFTGFIGGNERTQYSIMGSSVNLAARLMATAKDNEILTDENIYANIKEKYFLTSEGETDIKGFQLPVKVYNLISRGKGKPENLFTAKLTGREKELKNIEELITGSVNKNTPAVISVYGEAGIGKTRLLDEIKEIITGKHQVQWYTSHSEEMMRLPLEPFMYILKNIFKISEVNSEFKNNECFSKSFSDIIKELTGKQTINQNIKEVINELERTKSILGSLVDLSFENSLFENLDPKLKSENIKFAIINLFIALSIIKPLILHIEDAHWLDSDSRELIPILAGNIENRGFTLILTSRNIEMSKRELIHKENIKQIELELINFTPAETKSFAENLLGARIEQNLSEFLYEQTNGSPYFTEQLILDFKERSLLKETENVYSIKSVTDEDLPTSIYSTIISRLDRLPENLKEIIMTASVLGKEFDITLLKTIIDDKNIENKLHLIEKSNIWNESGKGRYIFSHAILRDTIYNMQLVSKLKLMHNKAAEVIEKQHKGTIPLKLLEYYCYHFGLAHGIINKLGRITLNKKILQNNEVFKQTVKYINLQTELADYYTKEYRNEKTIELYDKVYKLLNLTGDKETSFKILLKKADILILTGRYNEAEEIINMEYKSHVNKKDSFKKAKLNKYKAVLLNYKGNYSKGLDFIKRTLAYLKNKKEYIELSEALGQTGRLYTAKGRYKNAIRYYKKQFVTAEKSKDKLQILDALNNLGVIYIKISEYNKAMKCFIEYRTRIKNINDKNKIANSYHNFGHILFSKSEYNKSLKNYIISSKYYEQTGNKRSFALSIGNIGSIYIVKNNFKKAKFYYEKEYKIHKELNDAFNISVSYGKLGLLHYSFGEFNEALEYYKKQVNIDKHLGTISNLSVAFGNIGNTYDSLQEPEKAIQFYNLQFELDKKLNNKAGLINSLSNIGTVYQKLKQYNKAEKSYKAAIKIAKKINSFKKSAISHNNYAEVLLEQNKFKKATGILESNEKLCNKYKLNDELKELKNLKNKYI